MNPIRKAVAASTLAVILASGGAAFAQDHEEHHKYVRHQEWKKGYHLRDEDWHRGARVDYKRYHLHEPPRGYEWREIDGNYVLAAVDTGIVASVVVASTIQ